MNPYFTADNVKAAFECRFHFGWYTHRRHAKLAGIGPVIESSFKEVAKRRNYHVLEHETQPDVLRALLSLSPETAPAEVTRYMKGNLATAVRNECGTSDLWSRGWFLRSVGHVTNDEVQRYVTQQYQHHAAALPPSTGTPASYQHPGDPSALRASNHCKFEYNLHVVFVVARRRQLLDPEVATTLVGYLRTVCDKKQWMAWNIEVVWNHAHLFLGLAPSDAPGSVALSLLNNAEYFLKRRYATALRDEVERTVWQPGFYVGTVGSATTAQVKAFLARGDEG